MELSITHIYDNNIAGDSLSNQGLAQRLSAGLVFLAPVLVLVSIFVFTAALTSVFAFISVCAGILRQKFAQSSYAVALLFVSFNTSNADAQIESSNIFGANSGFAPLPYVSKSNLTKRIVDSKDAAKTIGAFCHRVRAKFSEYKWTEHPCGKVNWKVKYTSTRKNPLIYAEFGTGTNATLFMGGVHPDELTPIHLAFKFARHLHKNPEIYAQKNIKIVVAPLVNPDGFLRNLPTRTNANGVDVNRNFFTIDWYEKSIKTWRKKRRGKQRYFPGFFPNTEIETLFQIGLIDTFGPSKIISIHAPLGFLDYDGPGDQKRKLENKAEKSAKGLIKKMSRTSKNYRIVDYSFYPGSLGNYAGNERELATITLELETADASKVENYWRKFLPSLLLSLQHPFSSPQKKSSSNSTKMFKQYSRPTRNL